MGTELGKNLTLWLQCLGLIWPLILLSDFCQSVSLSVPQFSYLHNGTDIAPDS